MISITQYLYRTCPVLAKGRLQRGASVSLLLALMLALTSFTSLAQVLKDKTRPAEEQSQQQPSQQSASKKRGPRALAILEFLPGGQTRLVPVALWINDRFYDASLYGANPEPMALQPETVYEATDYGEPTGLFTVTSPEEVKGSWIATGRWKAENPLDLKLAQQAAKESKKSASSSFNVDADRPVLKRSGSDSGSGQGTSNGNNNASANEPPDRPVLKKPADESAPTPSDSSKAPNPSGDSSATDSSATTGENDPNRPVLRRGRPEPSQQQQQQATAAAATSQPGPMAATKVPATAHSEAVAPGKLHSYPAISDAGPYSTRSLLYAMNANERSEKSDQMRALAITEVQKFVTSRKTAALPKNASITDYDLRAFDLDSSNSPTFVLTAKLPVAAAKALRGGQFDYFVTVVAREDINGNLVRIFGSVTDSNHLDAFPRMEIIDAVDADANGRGDLLFRQYSDTGVSYSLYRVFPYDMQKVFEGGSSV